MTNCFRPLVLALAVVGNLPAEEEIPKVLRFSQPMISLSAVEGVPSHGAELIVENTGKTEFALTPVLAGEDATAFTVDPPELVIGPGKKETLRVFMHPGRGSGRYAASLDFAEGFIPVEGVGLKAFEGKNEPPFKQIVDTLGIPVNVGGDELELDTAAATIGDSLPVSRFRGIEGRKVRVTPVARFSPLGEVSFGIVTKDDNLIEWGTLSDSTEKRPDNHQSLFPEFKGGDVAVEIDAPAEPFAFYMNGHQYVSFTDQALNSGAPIAHTGRIYPVKAFQGVAKENAYLIAFEEAKNGDYQDAVFLIENVTVE